ncbi:MAG: replication endonuclease [Pseudomonadota bacterium]
MPNGIANRISAEWERRYSAQGRFKSNQYVMDVRDDLLPELFPETGLPFHATDGEIADAAERAVKNLRGRLKANVSEDDLFAMLRRAARRHQIEIPHCKSIGGTLSRMLDEAWWRRALRKRFRKVEHAAIKAGCVHRRAAPYISNEAFTRHQSHQRKTKALLENLEAINESTGETFTLEELRERSPANPSIRRVQMFVGFRGLEEYSKELGFKGVFVTITCPSRMHARHEKSGDPNKNYDETSPRQAQVYLGRLWNSATSKLARVGIKTGQEFFGLRTVEPHHDGTPHWHMLAFVSPAHEETFVATLREYALKDSPNEPGASERRFTVVRIDPKKGSAAGYIAKYVSKNTDGHGVGEDFEAEGGASENAPRVVVWSRLWGIRQFQFFGVGTLSPFRELHRLDSVPEALESLIGDLFNAAKNTDFAAYIRAREAQQAKLSLFYEDEPSKRYPGEQTRKLRGLSVIGDAGPVPITTRPDNWSIRVRQKPDEGFPWTCINNSAPVDLKREFLLDVGLKNRPNRLRDGGSENWSGKGGRGVAQSREPLPNSGPSL